MSLQKTSIIAAIAVSLLSVDHAQACGDKFLIVGRGSRFQRAYVSIHPASLMLVSANITGQAEIQKRLKIAGHRLQIVTVADIPRALASGRYDFILADVRDAGEVARVVNHAGSQTKVLPVIDSTSKAGMAAATKEYKCLLEETRGMKGARNFLGALDLALESKLKAVDLTCDIKNDAR